MTDLVTLARQAMALPGFDLRQTVYSRGRDGDYWTDDGVLDLEDPATGGILFSLLGCDISITRSRRETGWWYRAVYLDDSDKRDMQWRQANGSTLAEVCCRVAVARGRWG